MTDKEVAKKLKANAQSELFSLEDEAYTLEDELHELEHQLEPLKEELDGIYKRMSEQHATIRLCDRILSE